MALEPKTVDIRINVLPGIRLYAGLDSPYFVTDTDVMEAIFGDAYILLTDRQISNIQDILPLLEQVVQTGKPLAMIAGKIDGDALSTLLVNKLRGTLNVTSVDMGECDGHLIDVLQNIAAVTGGPNGLKAVWR